MKRQNELIDEFLILINACTQTAIRFLQRNTKFYSCTQTAILYRIFSNLVRPKK